MDPVKFPLDAWAYGGYPEVMRQTGWSRPLARREVRKALKLYGLKPIGHADYEELRRRIMDGEFLNKELS